VKVPTVLDVLNRGGIRKQLGSMDRLRDRLKSRAFYRRAANTTPRGVVSQPLATGGDSLRATVKSVFAEVGGLYKSNPVDDAPELLKAPGFNVCAYKVKTRFYKLVSNGAF
jgi:hypothetical protein